MSKITNGNWSAWVTNGSVRYAYKDETGRSRMVKTVNVPENVSDYFTAMLAEELKPSEDFEKKQATGAQEIPVVEAEPADITPASPEDFAEPVVQPAAPIQNPVTEVAAPNLAAPGVNQTLPYPMSPEEVMTRRQAEPFPAEYYHNPRYVMHQTPEPQAHPTEVAYQDGFVAGMNAVTPQPADTGQGFSIFDARLEDIARALFERFNIYTVFLKRPPEAEDISPVTGQLLSNYDRGLAYQAFRRAESQGLFEQDFDAQYSAMKAESDRSQAANLYAVQNQPTMPVGQMPHYQPPVNSFDYRTSPEHTLHPNGMQQRSNPEDSSDPIPEPPMNGQPIIRPNW